MATIGQALTAPETGWRRYDDTDGRILYTGTLSKVTSSSGQYNSSYTQSNTNGSTISFKFYGTKIRILSNYYSDKSNSIDVYIDGVRIDNFSEYFNGSAVLQCLVYEKTGLALGNHTIKLVNNTTSYMMLDAIDIDDTGYLTHPLLNEVHSFSDVRSIGDCIPCRYTATTSGQVGYFSELGITVAPQIPPASLAIPNGSFFWVYVGKDYLGRKKFIADRIIQTNISWNTLNSSGICSEKSMDLGLGNNYNSFIRLLTGGTSATDTDNEWDKIVVSSTLGDKIVAGDNNIWNWSSKYSWSSTSSPTNTNRIIRGNTINGFVNPYGSDVVSSTIGFRPVLLVETFVTDRYLLKKDLNYYSAKPEYYDEINHAFIPLTLMGGDKPNGSDIMNFGFDDLNTIITNMTKGSDTFKPIEKLGNNLEIKLYKTI
jgi:hypothetical protein